MTYTRAINILSDFLKWRNGEFGGCFKDYSLLDEAIKTAIGVLESANNRDYHLDADEKIRLIKSILNKPETTNKHYPQVTDENRQATSASEQMIPTQIYIYN